MKIAHLIFSGSWAGSEASAFAIASEQSKSHNVAVFVKEGKVKHKQYECKLPNNVNLYSFQEGDNLGNIVKLLEKKLIDYDIVHTHLGSATFCAKEVKKKIEKLKIVSHLHIRFYAEQFNEVDGVVAVSPWQIRDIPKAYKGKSCCVPNFLNLSEEFNFSEKEKNALKKKFFIEDKDYVFGVVSRLHIEKGVDVAIRAFRNLKEKNAKLIIFGDGSEIVDLKRMAASDPRISFGGFVVGGVRYMDLFDSYISPSRCDSFGISQLEAIFKNNYVIASKTYGSLDIFGDSDNLFDIDDENQLTNLMLDAILTNKKNIVDFNKYNANINCKILDDFYEKIICI